MNMKNKLINAFIVALTCLLAIPSMQAASPKKQTPEERDSPPSTS